MRFLFAIIFVFPILGLASGGASFESLTDNQVRDQIITESISSYPGACPCPEYRDRAGRRCGGRSAYSKPGGYSPKCYRSDVSDLEVSAYRKRKK